MKPKHILAGTLLLQIGCAHHAYKPQRIEIKAHTLILHETEIQMSNAYEAAWVVFKDKGGKKPRHFYDGFIDYNKNDLHCWGPWPEECMLHEYKHLGTKYGLKVPDDPHFERR